MDPSPNRAEEVPSRTRVFDIACVVLLVPLLATAFVDYDFFGLNVWYAAWRLSWALLILASLLDWEGRFQRRAALTAGLFVLWIVLGEILRRFTGEFDDVRTLWLWLWYYKAWPQWLLTLWIASPLLLPGDSRYAPPPGARVLTAWLLLFGGWQLAAAWAGLRPEDSISHYRLDTGKYIVGLLVGVRVWAHGSKCLRWLLWAAVAGAALQILGSLVAIVAAHRADAAQLAVYHRAEVVRFFEGDATWRVLFPMRDHNRLGAAMVANFFLLCLVFNRLSKSRWRWGVLVFIGLSVMVAAYTMTRGAVAVILVGILPLLAVRMWRTFLALFLVGALAVAALLPAEKRSHLAGILSVRTWTDPRGSVGLRVRGWHGALLMMGDHPWSGIGYSPGVFYEVYRAQYKERTGDTENKRHSHNAFLEFGAESGIPAMGLFVAFMFYRWWWFWRAFRRRPREARLLLLAGYELAMFLFNQFFFMYKGTQGLLLWAIPMGSAFFCIDLWREERDSS